MADCANRNTRRPLADVIAKVKKQKRHAGVFHASRFPDVSSVVLQLLNRAYPVDSRVGFTYFPGRTGTVVRVGSDGRVWVRVDQAIMDMESGETAPIAAEELRPL